MTRTTVLKNLRILDPSRNLDEMGSMGGAFDIGAISKAKEDWVLATTARIDTRLMPTTPPLE